jgi:peptidoglycan/xylan/chitin deacetylase (PgdA/CDA1 family)
MRRFVSRAKDRVFVTTQQLGIDRLVSDSRWRERRLLILCYHGVSQADEHEALRDLYVPANHLRARFELLRQGGYAVLPLGEALALRSAGRLPKRSVVLTFDDGFVDFYRVAYPLLREFRYPATVYVTTRYVTAQYPVAPPVASLILWRAPRRAYSMPLGGKRLDISTMTTDQRVAAASRIQDVLRADARPEGAHETMRVLANALNVDYDAICRDRLLYLMTKGEISALDDSLIDVQLHTHAHCQALDQIVFQQDLATNRQEILSVGIRRQPVHHYCYPSGEVRPELPAWLRNAGVDSATTCEPGIVAPDTPPLLLPRFIDTQDTSAEKFRAWLSGLATFIPRGRQPAYPTPGQ